MLTEPVERAQPVVPLEFVMLRSKPPSKQPHVRLAALSRSPMFLPDMLKFLLVEEQMSPAGSASLMSRESAAAVSNDRRAGVDGIDDAVGLPGDKVDGTRGRGAEDGAEGVVVHCIVLRVVPHRGDGVAVVVAHGERGRDREHISAGLSVESGEFAVPTESGKRSILPASEATCSAV